MPYRMDNQSHDQGEEEKAKDNYVDSEYILLDDLVYAPLHALSKSNQQLRAQAIETIRTMGTAKQNGQEETIHLNNINIAYDQIRQDGEEGYNVDNLQVQLPLLSIIPVTNLNVEKAEIDFATEVKAAVNQESGEITMNARICAPEQRKDSNLPQVTYRMKISSTPAAEGLMRLVDSLSSSHVVKKLDTVPVAVGGDLGTDEQKARSQNIKKYKAKIAKLRQLYRKIEDMIGEQERLHQISKDNFEEEAYEFDKDKYKMAQCNITNRIMKYEEEIMNLEITYGLDKDYE